MSWKLNPDRPVYVQLIERITTDIIAGIYPPGSKLPSVRDLAQTAGVNPNTMQKALSEMERTNLVYSQRTSGRFITEDLSMIDDLKTELASEQIKEFLEKMEKIGILTCLHSNDVCARVRCLSSFWQRKDFFAKSLNVFTSAVDTYFDMAVVQASDEKYNWTMEELSKLPVTWYGGADLSLMHDLTGTALHGRYKDVDIAITHAFMPIAVANVKAEEDNIPFFWWQEKDWLTMCNGNVIDYEEPVKWFIAMKKMGFKIKWVGYDRRYSREFVLKMKKAGFRMRDQSQRYVEKTEAFREIENKYKEQKFYYCHNRAYEYCIGNVKAIEDSDDFVRFEKVEQKLRIDLFDADVIAAKQMLIDIEKSQKASEWFS